MTKDYYKSLFKNNKTSVYFIAELGFNFSNDISLAKEMISAAKESGAHCVKFQSFIADKIVLNSSPVYNLLKENELSYDNHFVLKEYCEKNEIDFLTTPFDLDTLKFLVDDLKVQSVKISSGDLTFHSLLEKAAKHEILILLSTGLASFDEISESVNLIKKHNDLLVLLHCISNYPLTIENANLYVIKELKRRYSTVVGFSDHSDGSFLPVLSVALGSRVIEKHFTIDKKLPGPDNSISMTPDAFKLMVNDINKTVISLGDGLTKPMKSELEILPHARRSIYANCDIKKGTFFTYDNLKVVRPFVANSLPQSINNIINTKSLNNYKKNSVIENEK